MRTAHGGGPSLPRAERRSPVRMSVVVLLGAPGAGKGTQAPLLAEHLGVPLLASGDLLRAAVRAGTPLGREADRYMSRGQLSRTTRSSGCSSTSCDSRRRRRRDPRRLPADARTGRGARRARWPRTGQRVDRAIYIDVPLDDLVARMASRRICQANGHVYHIATNPPRAPGQLRPRRLAADPAPGRRGGDRPRPDGAAGAARSRRSPITTARRHPPHGRRPPGDRRRRSAN